MLHPDAIFVTVEGDWKLGGLDLVTDIEPNNSHLSFLKDWSRLLPAEYRSPELSQHRQTPSKIPAWACDMWSFATLCNTVLFPGTPEAATGTMPKDLQRACRAATATTASRRPSPRKVLDNAAMSFAHNPFVSTMTTVEKWALQVRS